MKVLIFMLTFFSINILNAQNIQRWNIDFIENGKLLKYPTAGGLNSPQFNEADLNHDGIQDLVVFDRAGNLLRTFINHGTPNKIDYTFEPQYIDNFPSNLQGWFLLRDYNKDGAADIFAFSDIPGISGIIVYKGYYDNNQLKFKRVLLNQSTYNLLYFPLQNNTKVQIYVSKEDFPDINDIDNDGDLDIVTFASEGGYVYLYSNKSVESGFGSDTLLYNLTDYCWGKFYEKGENENVSLSASNADCSKGFTADTISRDGKHVGSTLLTLDMDNDGDKEIILGDVSFPSIGMLTNGGTKDLAWMTAQEPFFPTKDVSAIVYTFPATFYLDVNNDQKKDFIVAPNAINASDDIDCNWLYLNSGITNKPVFKLNSKTFLNEDMVDWGSGAYMTFGDINADGLQDLLIGTEGSYLKNEGFRDIRMVYYKNIGTLSNPKFELADSNYLSILELKESISAVYPTFGDLDSDGDLDLIVGTDKGDLLYYENIAGFGNIMKFKPYFPDYFLIDVGNHSKPQILDINEDGLSDLLIGEQNGNLNYYKNIGVKGNPLFSKDSSIGNYGKIRINPFPGINPDGFSSPYFIKGKASNQLFVGSVTGEIYHFEQVTKDSFALKNSFFGKIKEGWKTSIVVNDLNNDNKFDFFIGNYRGGISSFTSDILIGNSELEVNKSLYFTINPNPSKGFFKIQLTENNNAELKVIDLYGKILMNKNIFDDNLELDLSTYPNGIYFIQVENKEGISTQKVVLQK